MNNQLHAISPIDGRYAGKTETLSEFFSEASLIKYRIVVEIEYFIALSNLPIDAILEINDTTKSELRKWANELSDREITRVKEIEKTTNHDVKAVEYILKEQFDKLGLSKVKEWIHFGLTSQDINNTAFPMMIRDGLEKVILPNLRDTLAEVKQLSEDYKGIPMLAHTHGQPASPTTMGKEFFVFYERLEKQIECLSQIQLYGKFGGATGNFNAHKVALPEVHWPMFADNFVEQQLGLKRYLTTTQIAHYDDLSELFDNLKRINVIFIDFSRDLWTYISMEYFRQKTVKNEVGSSAMPHKVNPIDFENAEGNLGMANAILEHLSAKLPISRLQRDLTDSTVMRNVGVPFAHSLIAYTSIKKGLNKLLLNEEKLNADLEKNYAVVAEAIQNILRRENYPEPYETLKELTRGKSRITSEDISSFIATLEVSSEIKTELMKITPHNYIGYF